MEIVTFSTSGSSYFHVPLTTMRHLLTFCRFAVRQPNDVMRPGWTAQAPLGWAHLHSSPNR